MNIGDLIFGFRGDGAPLKKDAAKAGADAGTEGAKQFDKSFSGRMNKLKADFDKKGGLLGSVMTGAGLGAGLGAFGLVTKGIGMVTDFITDAGRAASDLNETVSKLTAVFPTQAAAIKAWAKDSATAMGMSTQAALEATGTFGNFLQAMGQAEGPAADMSKAMVQLASDLASFNNENPEDVLLALRSGLSGETEPLRKYGVDISDAAIQTSLLADGVKKVAGGFTQSQKIQGRYNLILKQTVKAQGDYSRTASGTANAQRTAAAQTENLKARMGELVNNVQNVAAALAGTAALALTNALDAVGIAWNDLNRILNPALRTEEDVDNAIREMGTSLGLNVEALIAYSNQQRQFAKDAHNAELAQTLLNAEMDDFKTQLQLAGVEGDDLDKQMAEHRAQLEATADSTDKATEAQKANEEAMASAKAMVDAFVAAGMPVPKAMKAIADGVGGAGNAFLTVLHPAIKAIIPTLTELSTAVGSSIEASWKTIPGKIHKVNGKIKHEADQIKLVFHHALTDTRSDIKLRMAEINHALANPKDQEKLRHTLYKGMKAAEKARNKAKREGNVEAFALADAEYQYLKKRVQDIDALTATIKIKWKVEDLLQLYHTIAQSGGRGQFKAAGGPVSRGVPYIVGEKRPELFVPDSNGTILPSVGGGRSRVDFYVHDSDGGLARAGIGTAALANALRRWED